MASRQHAYKLNLFQAEEYAGNNQMSGTCFQFYTFKAVPKAVVQSWCALGVVAVEEERPSPSLPVPWVGGNSMDPSFAKILRFYRRYYYVQIKA